MNSTPNHHAQRIATTSVNLLNLNTPTNLPLVVKEYMCFQVDGNLPRQPIMLNPGYLIRLLIVLF